MQVEIYRRPFLGYEEMVLSSSGRLDISLRQLFRDPNHQIGKDDPLRNPSIAMNDSAEVLYVIEKGGYAHIELSKILFSGVDNPYDFTMAPAYEEITNVIDESGGAIEHPGGFTVDFPEGAFSSPVTVSVSRTDLPGALPSDVTATSSAFSVNTDGVKPETFALVYFDISPPQNGDNGTQGIYRWDGEQWQYAGGGVVDNYAYTYVRDFSIILTGIVEAQSKRLFLFQNTGSNHAVVYVSAYQRRYPDVDLPIAPNWGVPCFAPPFDTPFAGNYGYYPQGFYQFCADWEDDLQGTRHRFLGADPPNWTHVLGEHTSLIAPPVIYVDTGLGGSLPGSCDRRIIEVTATGINITGNWTGKLPGESGPVDGTIQITDGSWTFTSDGTITFTCPVAFTNNQEQYVILIFTLTGFYWKISWTFVSENQIALTFFYANETLEEAINETETDLENSIFTRVD